MDNTEERSQSGHKRRALTPWRIALIVILILLLVAGGVLASKWRTVSSLLTGSRYVSVNAATESLTLPPGFHAEPFYTGLSIPRMLTFSPDGTLFVAERGQRAS
ncbi:hypothetical protein [Ktedonospora formicarum]|uniref:Uncharacterized protein n=1 Tax=Ktedonospora formicarum TaxID=2778364 RepID=A0A8J3I0L0_9CHLR|nr:hypothetical protein [Ktedonospora formicarum]GHO43893.1 hypothetical protein KSX_20560 [Ktedonospora formicarum]